MSNNNTFSKIKTGLSVIASLFAIYVFVVGAKSIFHQEKVYIETNKGIYHCTPYCEAIEDMTETDIELMQESGQIWGSKPMSAKDAYYDINVKMCDYCYSTMERNKREEYIKPLRERSR